MASNATNTSYKYVTNRFSSLNNHSVDNNIQHIDDVNIDTIINNVTRVIESDNSTPSGFTNNYVSYHVNHVFVPSQTEQIVIKH